MQIAEMPLMNAAETHVLSRVPCMAGTGSQETHLSAHARHVRAISSFFGGCASACTSSSHYHSTLTSPSLPLPLPAAGCQFVDDPTVTQVGPFWFQHRLVYFNGGDGDEPSAAQVQSNIHVPVSFASGRNAPRTLQEYRCIPLPTDPLECNFYSKQCSARASN